MAPRSTHSSPTLGPCKLQSSDILNKVSTTTKSLVDRVSPLMKCSDCLNFSIRGRQEKGNSGAGRMGTPCGPGLRWVLRPRRAPTTWPLAVFLPGHERAGSRTTRATRRNNVAIVRAPRSGRARRWEAAGARARNVPRTGRARRRPDTRPARPHRDGGASEGRGGEGLAGVGRRRERQRGAGGQGKEGMRRVRKRGAGRRRQKEKKAEEEEKGRWGKKKSES